MGKLKTGVQKYSGEAAALGLVAGATVAVLWGANALADERHPEVVCQVVPVKEGLVPRVLAVGGAALDGVTMKIGERPVQQVEPQHMVEWPADDQGRELVRVEAAGHVAATGEILPPAECEGMTMPLDMRN